MTIQQSAVHQLDTLVHASSFVMPGDLDLSDTHNYVRQGGYTIVVVYLSVCLSVSNFAQKRPNRFA